MVGLDRIVELGHTAAFGRIAVAGRIEELALVRKKVRKNNHPASAAAGAEGAGGYSLLVAFEVARMTAGWSKAAGGMVGMVVVAVVESMVRATESRVVAQEAVTERESLNSPTAQGVVIGRENWHRAVARKADTEAVMKQIRMRPSRLDRAGQTLQLLGGTGKRAMFPRREKRV